MTEPATTRPGFDDLRDLVTFLRGPEGCPWDREQQLIDLRAYMLEEAHEVAAAIDSKDRRELLEELGDLLFQVVFISDIARDESAFDLDDVIQAIHDKMVARHPHVFTDAKLGSAEEVNSAWEERKKAERQDGSILDGVPPSLPALVAAYRIGQKAAGIGFDWGSSQGVWDKVREELDELEQELEGGEAGAPDPQRIEDELGDLLLTVASLARHRGIDPERALAGANLRFRRRFARVERSLDEISETGAARSARLEQLWNESKKADESV